MPKRRRLPIQISIELKTKLNSDSIFLRLSSLMHFNIYLFFRCYFCAVSRCVFLNSQPGGSALNTSKILSMLGEMNIVFCGMIGADSNGELIQKKLANCHLNVWWVLLAECWCTKFIAHATAFIYFIRKFKFYAAACLLDWIRDQYFVCRCQSLKVHSVFVSICANAIVQVYRLVLLTYTCVFNTMYFVRIHFFARFFNTFCFGLLYIFLLFSYQLCCVYVIQSWLHSVCTQPTWKKNIYIKIKYLQICSAHRFMVS